MASKFTTLLGVAIAVMVLLLWGVRGGSFCTEGGGDAENSSPYSKRTSYENDETTLAKIRAEVRGEAGDTGENSEISLGIVGGV